MFFIFTLDPKHFPQLERTEADNTLLKLSDIRIACLKRPIVERMISFCVVVRHAEE